jgi:uncharacterized phage protein (TIGR02218 family)
MLRLTRGKRHANFVKITPRLGDVLRFTDHDRAVTFDGEVYVPVSLTAMSARRVEAGMKVGNQEAYGIIDGTYVLVPDIKGDRYRGAEVAFAKADWSRPWIVFGRHRKWIRSVTWTGSQWSATMESRSQIAQRDHGGRFGGVFAPTCPYKLGGTHCRADISADVKTGVVVDTVVDDRMQVEFDAASWSGAYADQYYRDGEIEWTTGDNVGHISPIVSYVHTNRVCKFLLPTPFPIQVGDEGTARPGCDGLFSTCKTKWNNALNFGGDPYAPSSQEIIEPPEDQ